MKQNQKKALAIGAGATALAAAAAATYLLSGKRGAKNRAKVKKWVTDARKEVSKQVGGLQKVTKQTYNKAVDTAMKQYETLKNVDKAELAKVAAELKGHWDDIQTELKKAAKPVVKAVTSSKATAKKPAVKKAGVKSASRR